ncbi:MAG: ABC transporter ATP-binding protein [Candidatus Lokiarchaeota archaeon]|nr:ABC transporter ATP-binding protein [Candidatus Lokiarchaeota archaeon]
MELIDIKKEYDIGDYIVIALDDITLSIKKGDFAIIFGSSGAGKTTLLNIIGSLDKPTSGRVLVEGVDIAIMNEQALSSWRAINTGFIFQAFNLISTLDARENISFPAISWDVEPERINERVEELLQLVGLKDRADHLPHQLSAGEQQRVAIARALMNDLPLILADEPTANLDQKTAMMVISLLEKIKKMPEKTIIIATHDERIANLANRRFIMESGRIHED